MTTLREALSKRSANVTDVGLVFRTPSSSSVYLINCCTNAWNNWNNNCHSESVPKLSKMEKPYLLKAHLVWLLLRDTFPQDPVSFSNLINASVKTALAGEYRDIASPMDCRLTLGRSVTPMGSFSSSVEREHCTKRS